MKNKIDWAVEVPPRWVAKYEHIGRVWVKKLWSEKEEDARSSMEFFLMGCRGAKIVSIEPYVKG